MSNLPWHLPYARPRARVWPAMTTTARQRSALLWWAAVALVGAATFALRAINLNQSFDIFIDEVTYLRLSQSVAATLHVTLYGQPFYLHPPAFFFLEGAYLRLTHPAGDTLHQIYAVRYLNVGLAGLSAVALLLIGRRAAGWPAGLGAAALFALDPFIVQMGSENLLDSAAVWWLLAGYGTIIGGLGDEGARGAPLSTARAVAAGILFGLAALTKDMMAVVALTSLVLCVVTGWALPRRTAALIGSAMCLTYAPYPLIVAVGGGWAPFARQKFRGIERLAGGIRETGFHRPGGPSLMDTVIARLDQFGTTYLLIALGVPSILFLARRGGAAPRLIALWAASAYALLGYCILVGTLEEQFFYLLVTPALLAVAVAATFMGTMGVVTAKARRRALGVAAALAIVFIGWSGYRWARIHFTPSNGFERLLAYVAHDVPPQDRHIAATDETAQFLLGDDASGPWGSWDSIAQFEAYRPSYLLVEPAPFIWDHGAAASGPLNWIARHGRKVFVFVGNSGNVNDPLLLYRIPPYTLTGHTHDVGPLYLFRNLRVELLVHTRTEHAARSRTGDVAARRPLRWTAPVRGLRGRVRLLAHGRAGGYSSSRRPMKPTG